jgi:hypothetical protein
LGVEIIREGSTAGVLIDQVAQLDGHTDPLGKGERYLGENERVKALFDEGQLRILIGDVFTRDLLQDGVDLCGNGCSSL